MRKDYIKGSDYNLTLKLVIHDWLIIIILLFMLIYFIDVNIGVNYAWQITSPC